MTKATTADQRHREEMRHALHAAADRFGLDLTSDPVFGWRDRSIAAPATTGHADRWLRVVREHLGWAHGDMWTGNVDAAELPGVLKPSLLSHADEDEPPNRLRAEMMTRAPGTPCSPTPELRTPVELPAGWLPRLRNSLDSLTTTPTIRTCVTQADVTRRLAVFWGERVAPTVSTWTTAHGDLHWANLMHPAPYILDWELWGAAPAGYDAATLYCHSLLVPNVADQVRAAFADLLDTPDGRRAQLYAIARMLLHIEHGDYPDLAIPLHRLADQLTHTT